MRQVKLLRGLQRQERFRGEAGRSKKAVVSTL
jgi:hypothetical protein